MAANDDSQMDGISAVAVGLEDVSRPEPATGSDGSEPRSRSGRRRLLTILRVLVSAALLLVVLRRGSVAEFAVLLRRSADQWWFLLVGLFQPSLGLAASALRWGVLLRLHRPGVAFLKLYEACLVGTFFNQFFPSTIGGDVARSRWVARSGDSSPSSTTLLNLTVVALDRTTGLLGICAVAFAAALASPTIARQVPQVWLILALLALGVAAASVFLMRMARTGNSVLSSLPILGRLREKADTILQALISYRRQKHRLLLALLFSIGLQLLIIVQYWAFAAALTIDLSIWELAVLIPIVNLISMIPVAINGIGLREGALAALGASMGLRPADAVALAWCFMLTTLVYAALGGLINMRGRRHGAGVSKGAIAAGP